MTHDDIISAIKAAGLRVYESSPHLVEDKVAITCVIDDVGELIESVAAAEREACARSWAVLVLGRSDY